jgi:hypothetical protein
VAVTVVGVGASRKEKEERVGEYSDYPAWAKTSKERHALNALLLVKLFNKAVLTAGIIEQ